MIRVLIADDQPVVRRGLALFLTDEPDLEVVGRAASGPEAVRLAIERDVDVVLMDVRMPGGDGITATRELTARADSPAVVVVATFDLDEYLFGAVEAGASGFILKDCDPDELVAAVRAAAGGEAMVSPRMTRRVLDEFTRRRPQPTVEADLLSAREVELVEALCEGLSNAELANRLCIEVSTVKTHLGRICTRLGLRDRVQLVVWAYRHGFGA
ncbi:MULTISPECIES: response regulator transcription factor [unclassified Luteococcus]|uniref:response regulator transcription factor n=1 Tax=unclassified Luteococcus TaxID=2639923 RepID=UPI00313C64AE